ncbi:MAG: ChrR family anti-sigma-E factor [Rhodospirillales bacterium]|nr:ChrR family anti-sigma-E factor [Rhodospirillales bacterium]
MTHHHPPADVLFDYAAGTLSEGEALAVAAHASLCSRCAREIAMLEAAGGSLVDVAEPMAISHGALDAVLARLDEPIVIAPRQPELDAETRRVVPKPLHAYVGRSLKELPWRTVGRMYEEVRLPLPAKGPKVSLMRLKPGTLVPRHGHRGQEWTVVLAGGYHDGGVSFTRGDFDAKDASHRHQPRVDDDGECLCLVVLDAPLKLTGTIGLFVNPFLRI